MFKPKSQILDTFSKPEEDTDTVNCRFNHLYLWSCDQPQDSGGLRSGSSPPSSRSRSSCCPLSPLLPASPSSRCCSGSGSPPAAPSVSPGAPRCVSTPSRSRPTELWSARSDFWSLPETCRWFPEVLHSCPSVEAAHPSGGRWSGRASVPPVVVARWTRPDVWQFETCSSSPPPARTSAGPDGRVLARAVSLSKSDSQFAPSSRSSPDSEPDWQTSVWMRCCWGAWSVRPARHSAPSGLRCLHSGCCWL